MGRKKRKKRKLTRVRAGPAIGGIRAQFEFHLANVTPTRLGQDARGTRRRDACVTCAMYFPGNHGFA
jgi:hypothetical protein